MLVVWRSVSGILKGCALSLACPLFGQYMVVSIDRWAQYRSQNDRIPIAGTPQKVLLVLGTPPHMVLLL